jgi:hypothetical protein
MSRISPVTNSTPPAYANESKGHRGERSEGHRGERSEGRRGERSEGHRGERSEGRRGERSEGRRGERSEGHRGERSEGRRGERSEGHRGERSEGHRGERNDVAQADGAGRTKSKEGKDKGSAASSPKTSDTQASTNATNVKDELILSEAAKNGNNASNGNKASAQSFRTIIRYTGNQRSGSASQAGNSGNRSSKSDSSKDVAKSEVNAFKAEAKAEGRAAKVEAKAVKAETKANRSLAASFFGNSGKANKASKASQLGLGNFAAKTSNKPQANASPATQNLAKALSGALNDLSSGTASVGGLNLKGFGSLDSSLSAKSSHKIKPFQGNDDKRNSVFRQSEPSSNSGPRSASSLNSKNGSSFDSVDYLAPAENTDQSATTLTGSVLDIVA